MNKRKQYRMTLNFASKEEMDAFCSVVDDNLSRFLCITRSQFIINHIFGVPGFELKNGPRTTAVNPND